MTETLAIKTDQPVLEEKGYGVPPLPAGRPRLLRFARFVSNILAPTTISIPMIVMVAFYRATSVGNALAYAGLTLFFLSIGPFLYIVAGVRLGKLSDVDVSRRSERLGPFVFALLSICLGWFVLNQVHAPAILVTVVIMTALSGALMLLITQWWKISIHASCMAGAATVLTALYGTVMLPTFLLLVLVSWSRVVLHRHTVGQVIAGSVLNILLAVLLLKIRGI